MAAAPSTSPVEIPVASEDILSAKTDLCLSNAIVKSGIGLGAGIVASAILFHRRPWPVFVGLGFGFGQGYSDCERVFNPAAVPGFVIAGEKPAPSAASALAYFKAEAPKTEKKAEETVVPIVEKVKEKAVEIKDAVVGEVKAIDKKAEEKKRLV